MKRSDERILTTHTGSLPRPPELLKLIFAREKGEPVDEAEFDRLSQLAVADAVRKQSEAGIDIVSDGEMSKPAFATYVTHRLAGFGGGTPPPRVWADREAFPGWASGIPLATTTRMYCVAPIASKDPDAVKRDIRRFRSALDETPSEEAFIPAASPGIVADFMVNQYYPSQEAYLFALADALSEEYRAIVDAGFLLQIDSPDAAMARHVEYRNESTESFRRVLAQRVEALNHALQGIPEDRVRFHVCWGNYEGPHTHDVALADIVDILLQVKAGALSVEASNPRHAHEWEVWEDVKLPEGKILIPGVIDSTTNFVEHPDLVAQRIEQYGRLVGRENVIAGTDCGFGTSADRARPHPEIVWAKFSTLAEGSRRATQRLWR